MNRLVVASTICINLAVLLGMVDGIYYHLWKYRLFGRSESRFEHVLHTVRAFLFLPIFWLLYGENYGGWALWLGVFFVAADSIVELIDVLIERRSRADIGGLSTGEYAIHVNATALRLAALALIFAAKPVEAWSLTAPLVLSPSYPSWVNWFALNSVPAGLIGVLAHLWLMREKYRVTA